jgi:hypothetical protein
MQLASNVIRATTGVLEGGGGEEIKKLSAFLPAT